MNDLMLDIIKELSISAIRGSQVNINMEDFTTDTKNPFPIFIRKSAAPDTPLVPNNHRSNQDHRWNRDKNRCDLEEGRNG